MDIKSEVDLSKNLINDLVYKKSDATLTKSNPVSKKEIEEMRSMGDQALSILGIKNESTEKNSPWMDLKESEINNLRKMVSAILESKNQIPSKSLKNVENTLVTIDTCEAYLKSFISKYS
jgi:hypothetical protein